MSRRSTKSKQARRWRRGFHRCLRCHRLTRNQPALCDRCMHISTLDEARRGGIDAGMHQRMLDAVNVDHEPEPPPVSRRRLPGS